MKLTSAMIKQRGMELGLDGVGIASIDRFEKAPPLMNPKTYFPDAKSVIVTMMRIPRGSYRGIEEGTHWTTIPFILFRLNQYIRPRLTYALSQFIEDHGWEAVPCYPAVPERQPRARKRGTWPRAFGRGSQRPLPRRGRGLGRTGLVEGVPHQKIRPARAPWAASSPTRNWSRTR